MSGRELYRRWCELAGRVDSELKDEWSRLALREQLAWEDLAEELAR